MPKWLLNSLILCTALPVLPQGGLISPDLKAFQQANRISEASERIRALERFISEYPSSPGVDRARRAILDTAIKNWPEQTNRLSKQGESLIDNSPEARRNHVRLLVARKFVDANLLLRESAGLAESVARTSTAEEEQSETKIILAKIAFKEGAVSEEKFNAILDEIYLKRYPKTLRVERYHPTDKRTDRVVLAEVFTSADCAPCAPVDLAFDAALERFGRSDLVVLMYHVHIPTPDPLAVPSNDDRRKFYGVRGTPTWAIDGRLETGGGPRSSAGLSWDRIRPDIEEELESSENVPLALSVSREHSLIKVQVETKRMADARLHVALVERRVTYSGKNDIRFHPMVVRDRQEFAADSTDINFDIEQIAETNRQYLDEYESKGHDGETFKFEEKRWNINRQNLAIVAFVQRLKDKRVLQAAYSDVQ